MYTYMYVYMQLIVLVNGEDMFQYDLKLPVMTKTKTKSEQNQYFVGGGAVSSHTSERHISLVNATNYSISWKLGVLSILPGKRCSLHFSSINLMSLCVIVVTPGY